MTRYRDDLEPKIAKLDRAAEAAYAAAGFGKHGDPRVRDLPSNDPERIALRAAWEAADQRLYALRNEADRLPRRPRATRRRGLDQLARTLRDWGIK